MPEKNPYGDAFPQAAANAGEREWRGDLLAEKDSAEYALRETLATYPDFFNIPVAELPLLTEQAEAYLAQDEDEQDPKLRQRAMDILSLRETTAATTGQ